MIGNDAAITMGALGGVGSLFQLNVAMPMMADNMMQTIELLANVSRVFVDRCIKDLKLNRAIASGFHGWEAAVGNASSARERHR